MSDPYSGKPGEDPQTKNILSAYEEMDNEEKKGKKKKHDNSLTLYYRGISLLEFNYYKVEFTGKEFKLRVPLKPKQIEGISYPDKFRPYGDVNNHDNIRKVRMIFRAQNDRDLYAFWSPLWQRHDGREPVYQVASYIKELNSEDDPTAPLIYGQTHDPMNMSGDFDTTCNSPEKFVPDINWFPERLVKEVKFKDVFTLFPEAEREILKLLIGRVAVGRSDHIPPNRKKPIEHTSRMMGVVVGRDAGLGKSTLLDKYLKRTLQLLGYKSTTFRKLGERFGMEEVANSDICIKDDCVEDTLKVFLKSEDAKILTTNGSYIIEEKYGGKTEIKPRVVLLVNSNDWNPMLSYELDSGTIDRVKMIGTYLRTELDRNLETATGASKGSPDLQPLYHIPWLAEKYGVSIECIMAWAIRIAADHFWNVINTKYDEQGKPFNALEREVRVWSSKLRYQFQIHIEQAILACMFMCRALRTSNRASFFVPELTPSLFSEYLHDLYFICVDPAGNNLFKLFKEDWEKSGRPTKHFYTGIRQIRYESVSYCLQQFLNNPGRIKDMFATIQLRSGMSLGSGQAYIVENWQQIRMQQNEVFEKAKHFMSQISQEERDRILDMNSVVDDYWLKQPDYSPDRAEFLRKPKEEYKKKNAPKK